MVDATVLFAGTGWPRWSYEVLRHASMGDLELVLSPLVIEQARRNLASKFPQFTGAFDSWLELVRFDLVPDPKPEEVVENEYLVRDVSDVPIALSAIQAGVMCLVSEDKDLTDAAEGGELRKRLKVLRPVVFLHEVMGWSHEDLGEIRHRSWPLA